MNTAPLLFSYILNGVDARILHNVFWKRVWSTFKIRNVFIWALMSLLPCRNYVRQKLLHKFRLNPIWNLLSNFLKQRKIDSSILDYIKIRFFYQLLIFAIVCSKKKDMPSRNVGENFHFLTSNSACFWIAQMRGFSCSHRETRFLNMLIRVVFRRRWRGLIYFGSWR